jgi:hypothetical protein
MGKAPSSNIQAPEKLQIPKPDNELSFEVWCFSGAWMLDVGASCV